jgi:hypothetical protein
MFIWFIAIQNIASPRILSKGVPNHGQRIETREMDWRTCKKGQAMSENWISNLLFLVSLAFGTLSQM